MTKNKALEMALMFIERVNRDGWILEDFEPQMYEAITAIKEALETKDAYVQVRPWEFNMMTQGKEDIIGIPIAWSQWPNNEKNT
jgi:hypothetical protein